MMLPMISSSLVDALRYTFEPFEATRNRSKACIMAAVAKTLRGSYSMFPTEILLMIASHLLPAYALLSRIDIVRDKFDEERKRFSVDLTQPIWAEYVELSGNHYLSTIANQRVSETGRLVWNGTSSKLESIFISEDYLGIRDIFFLSESGCESNRLPPYSQVSDLWWSTTPVRLAKRLQLRGDVCQTSARMIRF